ncbi:MAG: hypothetical protein A2Y12_17310 [Planctomycetes bacterium GWF2_42_9]|nr:MAG: hypothetical protein A2Y12_17310 [Planctomycetes bacterium GWF2_42_9]
MKINRKIWFIILFAAISLSNANAKVLFWDNVSNYVRPPSTVFINLGDYAKGDGSDETAAIQAAFDALPPANNRDETGAITEHPGGILYIPRPKSFYGISSTIEVIEKWNCTIVCETLALGTRGPITPFYFRWLGADNGTMFNFRSCKGMRLENLSMCGMDANGLSASTDAGWTPPNGQRLTKGVTGITFGPQNAASGFQNSMIIDKLHIRAVATGIRLGDYPNNGPDVTTLTFRSTRISEFSQYGILCASGNLAGTTFETLEMTSGKGATAAIIVNAGEILVLNWTLASSRGNYMPNPDGAAVIINSGGIQIVKAWSEWWAPFLKTGSRAPETDYVTGGSASYPIILEGVRHFDGPWMADPANDPVPTSIIYDLPIPLHLIGCSLWGNVELGTVSQSTIIDQGTVFINKNQTGFTGAGATQYGRVISIGTRDPSNARILQPYVVDRRNTPGTSAPTSGTWSKGDRILNIDPANVAGKNYSGWICTEAGTPGIWKPFGLIQY